MEPREIENLLNRYFANLLMGFGAFFAFIGVSVVWLAVMALADDKGEYGEDQGKWEQVDAPYMGGITATLIVLAVSFGPGLLNAAFLMFRDVRRGKSLVRA